MKLTLFFTDGVSLQTWDSVGMFDREVAIYKKLQQRGLEIEFVTYGDSGDQKIVKRLPNVELRSNKFKLPQSLYKASLTIFPPSGQVFKSNQLPGAEVALKAARNVGAKFVARCGYLPSLMDEARYGKSSTQATAARAHEQHVFSAADRAVVTTQFAADYLNDEYGIRSQDIRVIPNYVETERFKPIERSKNDAFRIVTVGRLDYQKNLSALIEAVAPLDLELVIVGSGPDMDKLVHQAKGTKANIEFMGNVPNQELPELLNKFDAFVLPSFYEGHPKALLEAMSCGLPVIGTDVQGIREVIQDTKTGLLCATDPSAIREAIEKLQKDAPLRQKQGAVARSYVVENFALDRVVDMEFGLLNELANKK